MARVPATIVAVFGVLMLNGCISPDEHMKVKAANDDLQRQLADLERYHKELEGENRRLRGAVEELGKNVAEAEFVKGQKEELARLIQQFQAGGTNEIPGIKVIRTAEGVGFQVQGEILFASGQAIITKDGENALRQLLPTLREHKADLRIDGHTDTDPIRHSQWRTNLRLSAERAMAVVEFLTRNGLDANRCFVGAYGEHRPEVIGDDDASKRRNRRVEILMLGG